MISTAAISTPDFTATAVDSTRRSESLADRLRRPAEAAEENSEVREAFNDFVGQTFYGQMLSAMRSTVGEAAYFHGGRAEEVFTAQFDQVLAEKLSDASADTFTGPMFELFQMSRK